MPLIDLTLNAHIAEQRDYLDSLASPFPPPPDPATLLPAEDLALPDHPRCKVRVIRPEGQAKGVYLHLHGGGFVQGSAAMADGANSMLARLLGLATVSVDYRLAPAHRYPAPLEDCVAAAHWLIANADREFGTEALLIGGDSVGASLAVQTLLQLRAAGNLQRRFRGANLVVGNYDFSMTPSQRAATPAHFLNPEALARTREAAFPGKPLEQLRDPAISSLYADLGNMPPAIFSVGTDDSVLDDSLFMASRWQAAGNAAQLAVYPEAPHLFMAYPTAMSAQARKRIGQFLTACLQSQD